MSSVILTIVSADIPLLLRQIEKEKVILKDVRRLDDLTVRLQIHRRDQKTLCALVEKRGAKVVTVKKVGIYWKLYSMLQRPVLLSGILIVLLAGLYLPTRIFFIRVEGNSAVPARLILEAAGECGMSFGASAKEVRSEKVKNALLQAIPELQWAGVNTSGCVATISVRERKTTDEEKEQSAVSSIVAIRDGVICDMTVTNGQPVCKVGQAVSKGQILISGYVDCDRSVRVTRSSGEVYASTAHKIEAVMPLDYALRGEEKERIQKISIIFGKNRINFFSGSGILDNSCVKMYEENYLTLPGGFQLPIAIVTETWIIYHDRTDEAASDQSTQLLSELVRRYVKDQMIAGAIITPKEQFTVQEDVLILTGEYGCIEMIGREQNEEIIKP